MATARPDAPDDAHAGLEPGSWAESRSDAYAQTGESDVADWLDVSSESVLAAQRRLQGLLRANRSIIGDLTLPVVLRRIVEAACELVNARYGALGVLAPGGGLEQFVQVGIDDDTVAAMGHLPEGKGLLGALIDDPRPIRLPDLTLDPRSVGFPAGHPAMHSFLGVPIRVRGEVFGNIYLTGYDHDQVSDEDEEMIASLAATAGVAIENARLFQEAHRRQEWLRASTEITRQLLASDGEEPLQVIARRLQQIAEADAVNVVLPTSDGRRLMVEVATGAGAEQLRGLSYSVDGTVSWIVIETGQPVLIPDMALEHEHTVHLSEHIPLGPLMVLPLVGMARTRGALVVGRLQGRPLFTSADLEMATTFANHAALALELSDARSDRERVALLEDRDRIARDLHDHVIQRLFGAGLTVESIASGLGHDPRVARLSQVVDDIDETIRQIRTSIFRLRGPISPRVGAVRAQMLSVVSELAPVLGYQPSISFAGPVDTAVPVDAIDDVVAVLREGLTNVARHAGASQAVATLRYSAGELVLELTDDGIGMGETRRRSGLANLRERAERHGGSLQIGAPAPTTPSADAENVRGTMLRWSIPLT